MDEPIQDAGELTELKQQVADLRRQTGLLYFALAVLSLTLAGFVGLQARRAAKDLEAFRPQANQILDVNKKEAPLIQAFVSQLEAYGRHNPDYARKVLAKYGVTSNAPASTGATPPPAVP
jgi:hypothetical protein